MEHEKVGADYGHVAERRHGALQAVRPERIFPAVRDRHGIHAYVCLETPDSLLGWPTAWLGLRSSPITQTTPGPGACVEVASFFPGPTHTRNTTTVLHSKRAAA